MPLIKNPVGRIVEIDELKSFYEFMAMPGFTPVTAEEEAAYRHQRAEFFNVQEVKKIEQNNVYFATISGVGRGDGFGTSSQLIMDELKDHGFKLQTYFDNQKVGFAYHSPYVLMRMSTPYRIVYTMFESDKIPDEWHEYLRLADKIIVPSRWCASVFEKAGFYAEVVPLAYNQEIFKPIPRVRKATDVFTFIHYDSFDVRKGFIEVLTAFDQEFKKDEKVKLILKTTKTQLPFPLVPSQYPNIQIVKGEVPAGSLFDLLKEADCGVFPSRGEGFGMTPLEMMATGIPVILPNAHGISEYFNADCMIEVAIDHEEPGVIDRFQGVDIGKMPVVSVEDLRKKMRWAFEHREDVKRLGEIASSYVRRYSFKATGIRLADFINEGLKADVTKKEVENILPLEKIQ
jgi:glycosyltransferase involved in cell wall biosynthesis